MTFVNNRLLKCIAGLVLFLLPLASVAGCGKTAEGVTAEVPETSAVAEQENSAAVVVPLPDSTMENMADATLAVSLDEGGIYVDNAGNLQMKVKIYTYDRYDLADIANLKVGDTITGYAGSVEVTALQTKEDGTVLINGGLDENGIELTTDDSGVFYEEGFSDIKSWYEIGTATIRVSADFVGCDHSDLDRGEVVFDSNDFLLGEIENYNFTPYNTTIRIAEGQVVELNRRYTP